MSSPSHRRSYRLPLGYDVEFAFDGTSLSCEWSPHMPTGRHGRKLLPHYQGARHAFLSGLGIGVMVVDA